MAPSKVGPLMRSWRLDRRRSQLDLASDVGVSTRHLSFVETGRSRPSPELVLAVADHLDVPLRERNVLLLAAGYAPRYTHTPLDDPVMATVRTSIQRMLDAHDPYPGVVIDRQWNVEITNAAARALLSGFPRAVAEPKPNIFRMCLHPDGLAPQTQGFDAWAAYLLGQLRRTIRLTNDAELHALLAEVSAYPNVAALQAPTTTDDLQVLIPFRVSTGGVELSLFTTLTTFGTPHDVTLDELAIELFFPADETTDRALRGGSDARSNSSVLRGP